MTEEKNTTPRLAALYAAFPQRLRVFTLALALLVLSATALCILVAMKTRALHPELFSLWYSILAGPLSALWILPEQSNWLTVGFVNLVALFAHPLWPNRLTAAVSFLAFASWLFWGMAVSFSGV